MSNEYFINVGLVCVGLYALYYGITAIFKGEISLKAGGNFNSSMKSFWIVVPAFMLVGLLVGWHGYQQLQETGPTTSLGAKHTLTQTAPEESFRAKQRREYFSVLRRYPRLFLGISLFVGISLIVLIKLLGKLDLAEIRERSNSNVSRKR